MIHAQGSCSLQLLQKHLPKSLWPLEIWKNIHQNWNKTYFSVEKQSEYSFKPAPLLKSFKVKLFSLGLKPLQKLLAYWEYGRWGCFPNVSHLFFYFSGQEMMVRKVLAPVRRGQIDNDLL